MEGKATVNNGAGMIKSTHFGILISEKWPATPYITREAGLFGINKCGKAHAFRYTRTPHLTSRLAGYDLHLGSSLTLPAFQKRDAQFYTLSYYFVEDGDAFRYTK